MKKLFNQNAIVFAVALLVASVAVAALSIRGEPKRRLHEGVAQNNVQTVTPDELASWIIEGRRDFVVVDMRDPDDFAKGHVRGAVNCGNCHTSKEEARKPDDESMFVDLSKKLVLYTDLGDETIDLPKLLARNPRLYTLTGGYDAWKREVLSPVAFGGETDLEQVHEKQKREAVRAWFAGERTDSSKAAVLPITPIRRRAAHQPAGAHEGC